MSSAKANTKRIVASFLLGLNLLSGCAPVDGAGSSPTEVVGGQRSPNKNARVLDVAEAQALEVALRNDPDAQALIQMTSALADRAAARKVSKSAYAASFQQGGLDGAGAVLGYSRTNFASQANEFQAHMVALLARYPALSAIQSGQAVLASANFGNPNAEEEPGGCKWIQYLVCLSLCTTTGPWYIACALLCWCSYCTDTNGNPWGVCEL